MGLVTSLGADHVIDYTEQDFAQQTERHDLAIHLGGYRSVSDHRRALKPNGRLLLPGGDSGGHVFGPVGRVLKAVLISPFVRQKLSDFTVIPINEDLTTLQQLIEAGTVTPVIDRSYTLGEIPKAIQYLEEGHTPARSLSPCDQAKSELTARLVSHCRQSDVSRSTAAAPSAP